MTVFTAGPRHPSPDTNNISSRDFLYEDKYVPAPVLLKVIQDKSTNGCGLPGEQPLTRRRCRWSCVNVCSIVLVTEMTDLPGGYMYCCDPRRLQPPLRRLTA